VVRATTRKLSTSTRYPLCNFGLSTRRVKRCSALTQWRIQDEGKGRIPPPNHRSFPSFYTVFSQFWNFLYFCPLLKSSPGSATALTTIVRVDFRPALSVPSLRVGYRSGAAKFAARHQNTIDIRTRDDESTKVSLPYNTL